MPESLVSGLYSMFAGRWLTIRGAEMILVNEDHAGHTGSNYVVYRVIFINFKHVGKEEGKIKC